jgi:hypothetical protein
MGRKTVRSGHDGGLAGAGMLSVLAWVCLALGSLLVIKCLIRLTVGRAEPEMTEPGARRWAFAMMGSGLLVVTTGLVTLPHAPRYAAAAWATRLAGFALLGFAVVWWLRTRRQVKSAGGHTEAGQRPDPGA